MKARRPHALLRKKYSAVHLYNNFGLFALTGAVIYSAFQKKYTYIHDWCGAHISLGG